MQREDDKYIIMEQSLQHPTKVWFKYQIKHSKKLLSCLGAFNAKFSNREQEIMHQN